MNQQFPPGPTSFSGRQLYLPGRDMLRHVEGLMKRYGPLVHVKTKGEHLYIIAEPDHVREVLVTHQHRFMKGRGLDRARPLLGSGLLTAYGADHLRRRRMLQPAFHKERLSGYAEIIVQCSQELIEGWRSGDVIDVTGAMMALTMNVTGRSLFGTDVRSQSADIAAAMADAMATFWFKLLPFSALLERLPIPALRRANQAAERLDRALHGIISERRRAPGHRGDLLSMLLDARGEDGAGLTDQEVRDEAMTLFVAGHETTGNALAWTWYLLGRHPSVLARLETELDEVLHGRAPTVADLPSLEYLRRVINESLRLYPPAWILGRRALEPLSLGGYQIPAGSQVAAVVYLSHRNPVWFPEPLRFDPDRWRPENEAALPSCAYYPFGGGTRRCIGESFALMSLKLIVALVAQRYRLHLAKNAEAVPEALVTLRVKGGLKVHLRARSSLLSG